MWHDHQIRRCDFMAEMYSTTKKRMHYSLYKTFPGFEKVISIYFVILDMFCFCYDLKKKTPRNIQN